MVENLKTLLRFNSKQYISLLENTPGVILNCGGVSLTKMDGSSDCVYTCTLTQIQ